jgi:hypothetical protein
VKRTFLKADRARLTLGGKAYSNVGANLPDLFERFLHDRDVEAEKTLKDAHSAGIRFARCFGSTWGPAEFHLFVDDRRRWLSAFDRMLVAADRSRITIVPSLLFNADMLPGYVRATQGKDEHIVDLLTPGSSSNSLAVDYVTAIVMRYRNDPRVLFWEIGNEYNLEADLSAKWKARPANQIPTSDQVRAFLVQMAKLIQRIDGNHLVTSGNADMRPYAWHIRQAMLDRRAKPGPLDWEMDWRTDTFDQYQVMLRFFNPPPLHIISVHHYPFDRDRPSWISADEPDAIMLPWSRKASDKIGRPLFVGEFGTTVFDAGREQLSRWMFNCLSAIRGGSVQIAALWTWEYRSDDPQQARMALSPETTPDLTRRIMEINTILSASKQRP